MKKLRIRIFFFFIKPKFLRYLANSGFLLSFINFFFKINDVFINYKTQSNIAFEHRLENEEE